MSMAKSLIIVENENDRYTFEAIVGHMALHEKLEVGHTEWETQPADPNPLKPTGLTNRLKSSYRAFKNNSDQRIDRVGIIWDLDNFSATDRIKMVKRAIQQAYPEAFLSLFDAVNTFGSIVFDAGKNTEFEVKIACHFVGIHGKGEIEDVLKAIKNQASPLADCIDSILPNCLEKNGLPDISDKELGKLWINHYQRYDTLAKKDRNNANTAWKNVMSHRSSIFDFERNDIPELVDLKAFLRMMVGE